MANKDVVTTLVVKTENSQNTIKGLRKEISDLKKQLDSATIGSDEFRNASKELAIAQANLKTALADGTKASNVLEGSYNHLTATMAELKKEWRATADEVKRGELGQQIDNINAQLKELDSSIGNYGRNVGDYTNSFKEAFESQQKSTENTRIGLDGLQKTAAGLANGYAAVQGTMALLNIESEEFEKVMIKVQSAMAIAQGVGGLKDLVEGVGTLKVMFNNAIVGAKAFIVSLNGIKKAIAATGIGLFIVALGTVVAYWEDIKNAVGGWLGLMDKGISTTQRFEQAQKEMYDNSISKQRELNREIELMKANGASQIEIYEKEKKAVDDRYNKEIKILEELERKKAKAQYFKDTGQADKDDKEFLKNYSELYEKQTKIVNDLREQSKDYEVKIQAEEIKNTKKAEEEKAKARADAQAKATEDNKKAEEKRIADELKAQERGIEQWVKAERRKNKKTVVEEVELDLNTDGWIEESELANYQSFLDQRTLAFEESINAENLILQTQIDKLNKLEDAQAKAGADNSGTLSKIQDLTYQIKDNNAQIVENDKQTQKARIKANKEYEEDVKKREKLIADFKIQTASNVLGSLTSILGEETVAGKTAAIAQATIDTYAAANSAYKAMAGIPIVGPGLGAAAAAAAVVAGIANVKKIASTKTDGSGSDISGASARPNINLNEQMPIQYTRNLLGDMETESFNKSQKVYVLENEIREVQNNVEVKEKNSSF